MSLRLLVLVLLGVLALLSVLRARGRAEHRPVAWFTTGATIADAVRWGIGEAILKPFRALHPGVPYAGVARAVFHLDEAMFLVWPLGLAALAFAVFLDRAEARTPVLAVLGTYAVGVVVLVLGYPTIRGELLARVYRVALVAGVAAAASTGLAWWRRPGRPTLTDASTIVLACLQLGAALTWSPEKSWEAQRVYYSIAFGVLGLFHLGALWIRRRTTA
jgi:hypothetical protein